MAESGGPFQGKALQDALDVVNIFPRKARSIFPEELAGEGIEPPTQGFSVPRSTTELTGHI